MGLKEQPTPGDTLAERLNYLIATAEGKLGDQEISREVSARGGHLSRMQLGRLRNGGATNPQLVTITQLAEYFDVPVSFLSDFKSPEVVAQVIRKREGLEDDIKPGIRTFEQLQKNGDAMKVMFRMAEMDDRTLAVLDAHAALLEQMNNAHKEPGPETHR